MYPIFHIAKFLLEHPLIFLCLMWWGFIYYSAVLRVVPATVETFKDNYLLGKAGILIASAIAIAPCLPFLFVDVLWRFSFGGLMMMDFNRDNGWTFSQMLCSFFHGAGWRAEESKWWARVLNFFAPGHIS